MKEFILIVALFLATYGMASANVRKNVKPDEIVNTQDVITRNSSTPHIVSFFDVEKIVIKNENKYLIKIYDSNWKLIKETTDDVNMYVIPGTYYVACEKRIKPKYISLN